MLDAFGPGEVVHLVCDVLQALEARVQVRAIPRLA